MPLEPLSRLQYLQFQILLSLVLIQSSTKKRKVSTICFIEIVFFKKVVSSAYGQQQWQWSKIVKPLITGSDFIRWDKICKAKIRKLKLGYLGGRLSQAENTLQLYCHQEHTTPGFLSNIYPQDKILTEAILL